MRPPWDHNAQGAGELEALQTDVMRFIAILGLCLAAIFSLVNSAQEEPRDDMDSQVAVASPTAPSTPVDLPPPTPVAEPAGEPESRAQQAGEFESPAPVARTPRGLKPPAREVTRQQPAEDSEQRGFTLEFESGDALERLLAAGRIRLFARAHDRFWMYRKTGAFEASESPGSYYRMQFETVPMRLRRLLQGVGAGETLEWGVTLPHSTLQDIQQLMNGRRSGSLIIDANADVRLEG